MHREERQMTQLDKVDQTVDYYANYHANRLYAVAYAIQLKGLLFFQPEPLCKSVQKPKTQQRPIEATQARKHICISFGSIISQYLRCLS